MRNLCLAAAAALFAASVVSAAGDGVGLYLFRIPAEQDTSTRAWNGQPALLDLYTASAASLEERVAATTLSAVRRMPGVVRLQLQRKAVFTAPPATSHSMASFVVDFDEPVLHALSHWLRDAAGGVPTRQQLVTFTYHYIETKSYRNGFDIASQVAFRREGDCTEHAVLVTALSRALGKPARVVFGMLVTSADGAMASYGHAWSEIFEDGAWHIADATLPEERNEPVYHIPLQVLTNEGPGFALALMELASIQPTRVVHIADQ